MFQELHLTHFRSHTKTSLDITPGINLVVGANGCGKTNVVEAIHVLSQGKSFLTHNLKDCINWNHPDFAIVKAVTDSSELEFILDHRANFRKVAKVDGGKIALKYFAGRLPVVLFEPKDLNLVTGGPSLRRDVIDRIISQVSLEYRTELKQMQRVLTQRNSLLKKIKKGESKREELTQWNELLARSAMVIIVLRRSFFNFAAEKVDEIMAGLSDNVHTMSFNYLPSIENEDQFADLLALHKERDIAAGMTLTGPHRDDFDILFNGKEASAFASRGEQRLGIISLLLIERLLINKHLGEEPVFLFDDVLSELDVSRQELLFDTIKNCQVIITSAGENQNLPYDNKIEL